MELVGQFLLEQWIIVLIAVISGAMLLVPLLTEARGKGHISALQATQMINQHNAIVLDIREQAEYVAGHIIGARHMPHQTIKTRQNDIEKIGKHPVIVSDQAGQHANAVATQLNAFGVKEVFILSGGVRAWREAGLPLVK